MGPARSATLDPRRRLFAPTTPLKMGGVLSFSLRAAAVASVIAIASAIGNQAIASADTERSIPVMGPQNSAWEGAPPGTSVTESIGSAGCAITAVTMMLRYYGLNTDPGAFNAWLTSNGGYAFDDQLIWDAVTSYSGGRVAFSGWLGPAPGGTP